MVETKIEWADYTWNPWRGCSKVDSGCTNCYAETMSKRNPKTLGVWGPNGSRAVGVESYWRLPLKWDAQAAKCRKYAPTPAYVQIGLGVAPPRPRVFCGSLMDWLEDRPELIPLRARLLATIAATPNLDWLLLSKRPEGWADRMAEAVFPMARASEQVGYDAIVKAAEMVRHWRAGTPPPNVWAITSVNDQASADKRIPQLLQIPARVHGVSYEPATGPIDFYGPIDLPGGGRTRLNYWMIGKPFFPPGEPGSNLSGPISLKPALDWVIVGGESGPHARPFDVAWARSTVEQCGEAGVACFVKQLGARPIVTDGSAPRHAFESLHDHKGGDMSEWPADLRVRQIPGARP